MKCYVLLYYYVLASKARAFLGMCCICPWHWEKRCRKRVCPYTFGANVKSLSTSHGLWIHLFNAALLFKNVALWMPWLELGLFQGVNTIFERIWDTTVIMHLLMLFDNDLPLVMVRLVIVSTHYFYGHLYMLTVLFDNCVVVWIAERWVEQCSF